MLKFADLTVVQGVSMNRGLPQALIREAGLTPERVFPLPIGVMLREVAPASAKDATSGFVVAYAGYLRRGRGIDNLLVAMAGLRELVPQATLLLIGDYADDTERTVLTGLISQLNLQGVVDFRGYQSHEETVRLLQTADVCVCPFPKLPALEYAYTLKIPEYLALGKAVVATDLLCNRDLIVNEENGILLPDNAPGELCRALYRLYREPMLKARLAQNARSSAAHLDWQVLLEKLADRIEREVNSGE